VSDACVVGSGGGVVGWVDGDSGIFTEIYESSNWHRRIEDGSIHIGDAKFRNIVRTSDTTWSCMELDADTMRWNNTTITMDKNGDNITTEDYTGIDTYVRVRK
jgi:hypothetical protein